MPRSRKRYFFFTSESFISFCEYTKIFVLPQTTCKYDRHEVCCESKLLISVKVYVSNPYKSTLATLVRFSFRKSSFAHPHVPTSHVPRPHATSHVPTSPRPQTRVPRPSPQVPVPLLVTANNIPHSLGDKF